MAIDLEMVQESGFPQWTAVLRKFDPNSPFFESGNIERELLAKQVALDFTEDERWEFQNMEDVEEHDVWLPEEEVYFVQGLGQDKACLIITCPIVGCGANLNSLEDFEEHYHARHMASCSVCHRVFPTSRLLSIHVSEAHDSFFQAKVARGFAMYECLVEGCGVKLKSYKSRQQHLIDKHKFPVSFEFFKKARLSKKQRQKQQKKQTHCGGEETKEANMEVDKKMEDLVSGLSKLSTSDSPSTISFGRRHNRGFALVPRAVQRRQGRPESFV